jgi:hypothetical protein
MDMSGVWDRDQKSQGKQDHSVPEPYSPIHIALIISPFLSVAPETLVVENLCGREHLTGQLIDSVSRSS